MEIMDSLIGKAVTICANDFVNVSTRGFIRFANVMANTIVIELKDPVKNGNLQYEWAVASTRLARENINTLINAGAVGCGITWVSNVRFDPNSPFDLSWWRGGAAAISDVMLD